MASGPMLTLAGGRVHGRLRTGAGRKGPQFGFLTVFPSIGQVLRLPVILAAVRFRRREAIGLPALLLANLVCVPIGTVPLPMDSPGSGAVALEIGLLALRRLFAPLCETTRPSWMHDLASPPTHGRSR